VSRVDGQERRTHIVPGGADDGKQVFQTPSRPLLSFCETRRMPKTQYFTATSIDGFIADLDNSLDWLYEAHTADHGEGRWDDFIGAVGAMAMGATTYEWVLEHERLLEEPRKWHDCSSRNSTPWCPRVRRCIWRLDRRGRRRGAACT
jgi:hypothetical protein